MEVMGLTTLEARSALSETGDAREAPRRVYLVGTEMMVGAGHTAGFEQRQTAMAEEATGVPGFVGGSLLRSYSHPAK
jgi:hypothetical protein